MFIKIRNLSFVLIALLLIIITVVCCQTNDEWDDNYEDFRIDQRFHRNRWRALRPHEDYYRRFRTRNHFSDSRINRRRHERDEEEDEKPTRHQRRYPSRDEHRREAARRRAERRRAQYRVQRQKQRERYNRHRYSDQRYNRYDYREEGRGKGRGEGRGERRIRLLNSMNPNSLKMPNANQPNQTNPNEPKKPKLNVEDYEFKSLKQRIAQLERPTLNETNNEYSAENIAKRFFKELRTPVISHAMAGDPTNRPVTNNNNNGETLEARAALKPVFMRNAKKKLEHFKEELFSKDQINNDYNRGNNARSRPINTNLPPQAAGPSYQVATQPTQKAFSTPAKIV